MGWSDEKKGPLHSFLADRKMTACSDWISTPLHWTFSAPINLSPLNMSSFPAKKHVSFHQSRIFHPPPTPYSIMGYFSIQLKSGHNQNNTQTAALLSLKETVLRGLSIFTVQPSLMAKSTIKVIFSSVLELITIIWVQRSMNLCGH